MAPPPLPKKQRVSQGCKLLRRALKNRALRQADLVAVLNEDLPRLGIASRVTAMQVNHIYHDRRRPTFAVACSLWRCLGVSPDAWLLKS
jgi:plasmid maintenance system antidote protein VapI